ncbi:MAG: hypothetical protein EOO99_10740 [Pedobacter sp.]|nr:MAG: hypothetical protein EOO99_10740 [Pedobacter sp.]
MLISLIEKDFEFPKGVEEVQLAEHLEKAFDYLIREDFNKLLQILYRADVDQEKLKSLLAAETEKSQARVIAEAYIIRQQAKIEIRAKFGKA